MSVVHCYITYIQAKMLTLDRNGFFDIDKIQQLTTHHMLHNQNESKRQQEQA